MKPLNRPKLFKKMWKFLNKHFGYSYAYPDIYIRILNEEEIRIIFEKVRITPRNSYEKEKNKLTTAKYQADAILFHRKEYSKKFIERFDIQHEFEIVLADAKINSENFSYGQEREALIKAIGFMNYYYFLVFHEFIHILEWLSGNHSLYFYDEQDLELFNSFMGWDYKIVCY